jgi:hypothetical protein
MVFMSPEQEREMGVQQRLPLHAHVCPKCGKASECYQGMPHYCQSYTLLLCIACAFGTGESRHDVQRDPSERV